MSVSNYLNRNCCAKCRHFYRDLIIHYTEEELVKMKAGLCTRNAPNPVVFDMANSNILYVPPVVLECSICGDFEARCPWN